MSEKSPKFDPDAPAGPLAGIFGLGTAPQEAGVRVLGIPFDATTSYRKGAARAPQAILAASTQVDLHDPQQQEWGRGDGQPWAAGIHYLGDETIAAWNGEAARLAAPIIERAGRIEGDAKLQGALERVNEIGSQLNARVESWTRERLVEGVLPVLVGGDHSIPFGGLCAAGRAKGELGILHIDAHADLRVAYEGFRWSHASIMDNVLRELPEIQRVLSVGLRDVGRGEIAAIEASRGRVQPVFAHTWATARARGQDLVALAERQIECLPEKVWLSVDIDGLDPAWCPATGTPVPGGLTWDEALIWLGCLVNSGRRIVGLDLSEVNPGPVAEHPVDSWDAIVGARLLYKAIGAALASRPAAENLEPVK